MYSTKAALKSTSKLDDVEAVLDDVEAVLEDMKAILEDVGAVLKVDDMGWREIRFKRIREKRGDSRRETLLRSLAPSDILISRRP